MNPKEYVERLKSLIDASVRISAVLANTSINRDTSDHLRRAINEVLRQLEEESSQLFVTEKGTIDYDSPIPF